MPAVFTVVGVSIVHSYTSFINKVNAITATMYCPVAAAIAAEIKYTILSMIFASCVGYVV
jgi:hypothetical protein